MENINFISLIILCNSNLFLIYIYQLSIVIEMNIYNWYSLVIYI